MDIIYLLVTLQLLKLTRVEKEQAKIIMRLEKDEVYTYIFGTNEDRVNLRRIAIERENSIN